MSKRIRIVKLLTWEARGGYWIGLIMSIIQNIMLYSGMVKLLIPKIPTSSLLITMITIELFRRVLNVFLGYMDYKKGLYKQQQEWLAKDKVMAPWNVQTEETIKAICRKLNVEHKYL